MALNYLCGLRVVPCVPPAPSTNGHRPVHERPPVARRHVAGRHPAVGGTAHSLEPPAPPADPAAERAVADLLRALGEDPGRDGLRDTPARVARALTDLTRGTHADPASILATTFPDPYDSLVLVRDIRFASLCEHHLLPFEGTASVAYVPDGRVVGLSKIARLVESFAARLQLQERLTREVAGALMTHLGAKGVAVHVEASHACMSLRGVRNAATTVTLDTRGTLASPESRAEFLRMVDAPRQGASR